jgi:hypothetical protein
MGHGGRGRGRRRAWDPCRVARGPAGWLWLMMSGGTGGPATSSFASVNARGWQLSLVGIMEEQQHKP